MKVRSKLIASIAVALVAVAGIAGPASASVEGAEAEFLEQLESIGVQARYQQVDDSGENGGLQAKGAVFSPYACDLNPSRTHKRAHRV